MTIRKVLCLVLFLGLSLVWQHQCYASEVVLTQAEIRQLRQEFQLQVDLCNRQEAVNTQLQKGLLEQRLEIRSLKEKSLSQETMLQLSKKALDDANLLLEKQSKEQKAIQNKLRWQRNLWGGIACGCVGVVVGAKIVNLIRHK